MIGMLKFMENFRWEKARLRLPTSGAWRKEKEKEVQFGIKKEKKRRKEPEKGGVRREKGRRVVKPLEAMAIQDKAWD